MCDAPVRAPGHRHRLVTTAASSPLSAMRAAACHYCLSRTAAVLALPVAGYGAPPSPFLATPYSHLFISHSFTLHHRNLICAPIDTVISLISHFAFSKFLLFSKHNPIGPYSHFHFQNLTHIPHFFTSSYIILQNNTHLNRTVILAKDHIPCLCLNHTTNIWNTSKPPPNFKHCQQLRKSHHPSSINGKKTIQYTHSHSHWKRTNHNRHYCKHHTIPQSHWLLGIQFCKTNLLAYTIYIQSNVTLLHKYKYLPILLIFNPFFEKINYDTININRRNYIYDIISNIMIWSRTYVIIIIIHLQTHY